MDKSDGSNLFNSQLLFAALWGTLSLPKAYVIALCSVSYTCTLDSSFFDEVNYLSEVCIPNNKRSILQILQNRLYRGNLSQICDIPRYNKNKN